MGMPGSSTEEENKETEETCLNAPARFLAVIALACLLASNVAATENGQTGYLLKKFTDDDFNGTRP